MDAACAAGVVRYVLINFCGADGRVQKKIKKYKCLFSPTCLQEGREFIGWWIIIPKQTTARDVLLEEVGGVVMAHFDPTGQLVEAVGGVAEAAHAVHGNMQNVSQVREMATGEFGAGVTSRFSRAWAAGTYSSIKDTDLEFSVCMPQMVLGGAIHMTEGRDSVTGSIRVYHEKSSLISFMGYGEHHGNVQYCKNIAKGGTNFIF